MPALTGCWLSVLGLCSTPASAAEALPLCPGSGLVASGSTSLEPVATAPGLPLPGAASLMSVGKIDAQAGGTFATLLDKKKLLLVPPALQIQISRKLAKASSQAEFKPWLLDQDLQARSAHVANIGMNLAASRIALHPRAFDALATEGMLNRDYADLLRLQEWSGSELVSGKLGAAVAKIKGASPFITHGGGETPRGNLGGLKPGQHVGKGESGGKPCLRAAQDQDFMPGADGEINVVYDPAAFEEVGKILYFDEAAKRRHLCTVIAVADEFVLTAAHCALVREASTQEGFALRRVLLDAGQATVLFPKPGYARDRGLDCLGGVAEKCGYHKARILEIFYPEGQRWKADAPVPRHDVALLRVQYEGGRPPLRVQLAPMPGKGAEVSIAGYGSNDIDGQKVDGVQYAGWQRVRYVEADGFGWVGNNFEEARRVTSVCSGDSGGPVYNGVVNNAANGAQFRVSAVLSFIRPAPESVLLKGVERCERAVVKALALAPYRNFICAKIGAQSHFCK
jgi:hypothetical protein